MSAFLQRASYGGDTFEVFSENKDDLVRKKAMCLCQIMEGVTELKAMKVAAVRWWL